MGNLYRKHGRTIWQMKYYRDGVPIFESSKTADYDEAMRLLKIREGAIAKGEIVQPRADRLTFTEAADDIKADYVANRRKSYDELERRIRLHLEPFFGAMRMIRIRTSDVRRFQAERLTAGASPGEINRELTALKRMFTLAVQAEKLPRKPHIPMLDEDNVRTGFFAREDLDAIVNHLPRDLRNIPRFAYITGWRIDSEVLPLEWRRVDLTERLSPDQQVQGIVWLDVGRSTKNKRGRVFPMTKELREILLEQQERREALKTEGVICPWVFHRSWTKVKGKRITTWIKAWRKACVSAGLPGRIPHDFRRTAVRNLVRKGIAERVAMQMTGHKTRSVFERYNIVSDNDLSNAAARFDGPVVGATVGATGDRHS